MAQNLILAGTESSSQCNYKTWSSQIKSFQENQAQHILLRGRQNAEWAFPSDRPRVLSLPQAEQPED